MVLTLAGRGLVWQKWDEHYIVYQPSSTETHVFNETTALILKFLGQQAMSLEDVRDLTEEALGLGKGDLADSDVRFALGRLEALGLVDCP